MPGCPWLTPQFFSLSASTDASGSTAFTVPLSNTPNYVGAKLLTQWIIVDSGANPLGLIMSNGGEFTIGKP